MLKPPKFILQFGDKAVEWPPATAPAKPKWKTGYSCIDHILNEGQFNPLMASERLARNRSKWRRQLAIAAKTPPATQELSEAFHTQWHVCHSRLRELVDDDNLLFELMWSWLPRYNGPDLVLYRGENIDRFQAGRVGSAWSDKRKTAEMFAGGLNAAGQGGLLLQATVPASLIIAGPSDHSLSMGESEFSVDTRKLTGIATIATFPPPY